jgi:hypothetical protein
MKKLIDKRIEMCKSEGRGENSSCSGYPHPTESGFFVPDLVGSERIQYPHGEISHTTIAVFSTPDTSTGLRQPLKKEL